MKNNFCLAALPPLLIAAFALLCAACVSETTQTATADAGGERECRSIARSAGSKMRSSECHSPDEWAVIDAQAAVKKTIQNEFFRRVGEGATLGAGSSSQSGSSGAGLLQHRKSR